MIIVMKPNATPKQISAAEEKLRQLGFGAHTIVGEQRVVIGATGDKRLMIKDLAAEWEGVDKVVPILQPYKLAGKELQKAPTVIRIGDVAIGDGSLVVAA